MVMNMSDYWPGICRNSTKFHFSFSACTTHLDECLYPEGFSMTDFSFLG